MLRYHPIARYRRSESLMLTRTLKLLLCVCLLLSGGTATAAADFKAALAAPDRSDADRERDATSKPAEVLAFFEVAPGMRVADLFAGGGYYSEILSHAVGPTGRVTAHNNGAYAQFAGEQPARRFGDNRLGNVDYIVTEANALQLPGGLDLVIMVMSFHDLYWVEESQGWPAIDRRRFIEQVFASLRPGGSLGIVDHSAAAGSGIDAVGALHRIDEAFVKAELEAVGFRLAAASDILRNPQDDRTKQVFDPSIRRKTDRFVLRFEKP
jgi:predicted methyltransferase